MINESKKLLVIGSRGQLARALKRFSANAIFLDRSIIDLSAPDTIPEVLKNYNPYAIINAAAYTQVDNAEKEEALTFLINAKSPAAMAIYCAFQGIPFISFSSDYVFDGSGNIPWKEDDATNPLNVYGRSKVASEEAIASIDGKHLIFRTSWVYDAEGRNFLNAILKLASEREELSVINDQFGAPTYAEHLAKAVLSALEIALAKPQFPSGIYHVCNGGVATWHDFATAIIGQARGRTNIKVRNIHPIATSEYPLPAKRPFNSRLDCSKIKSIFTISMPDWKVGLQDCMKEKYESH